MRALAMALSLLALAGCGGINDPLGITDMMDRCAKRAEEQQAKGEKVGGPGFAPVPFLACR